MAHCSGTSAAQGDVGMLMTIAPHKSAIRNYESKTLIRKAPQESQHPRPTISSAGKRVEMGRPFGAK